MSVLPFLSCPFVPPLEERDVSCQSAILWRNDALSWGPCVGSRQLPVLLPWQAEPQETWGTYAYSICCSFSVNSVLEKYARTLGVRAGAGERGKGSLSICSHLGMFLLPSSSFICSDLAVPQSWFTDATTTVSVCYRPPSPAPLHSAGSVP